jgi:hypothetical protein
LKNSRSLPIDSKLADQHQLANRHIGKLAYQIVSLRPPKVSPAVDRLIDEGFVKSPYPLTNFRFLDIRGDCAFS